MSLRLTGIFCSKQLIQTRLASSHIQSTNSDQLFPSTFTNRNPRNLEKMQIGYKPDGYHLERFGKCFWYKLKLSVTNRHVTATAYHFEDGDVIKACTSEWCIKKHLFRSNDTSAYINLGRIFADRCLQFGLNEICCDIKPPKENGKIALLLKAIENGGVRLEESKQFKKAHPWDMLRPEKPWEIHE